MAEKQSLWQRLRAKHRVAVINEETLGELFNMRLSLWNMIIVITAMLLLALLLFALVVWYTPLKSYLPGFNEDIREELVADNARVDSLLNTISVQNEYLSVVKQVIAGEVEPDSVRSLDSIYVRRQAELLEVKSQIEADFVDYYESKGKDQLSLFDMAITQTDVQTFMRPTTGVVAEHFDENHYQGVRIDVPRKERVMAVLNGTVVAVIYNITDGWTVLLQHDGNCLSVYGGLEKPTLAVGTRLKAGDIVGVADDRGKVAFQLWQNGRADDPEQVIAF